jgi:hypothetical protein
VADRGDGGAAVQQCDAPGVTVYLPQAQTAATTTRGRCGQEGLAYTPAQEVSVCPAGATLTDRVGSEEQGRTLRDDAPAACGRCAWNAHGTRTQESRRMPRWDDEDVRERRQQRLAHQPEMRLKRTAMAAHPVGAITRRGDQGACLRRGKQNVSTARSWRLLADTIQRGRHSLGVKTRREALA